MVYSILFVICYILMNVASAFTSVYLSDWSEKSAEEAGDIKKRNIRLIGYSLIGISQCNQQLLTLDFSAISHSRL